MSTRQRLARLGLATATAVMLVAALAPAASAATGQTRWVDSDGKAGPSSCDGSHAAAKTVQKAVNNSGPNDTILVCPGTYRGTVDITGNRAGLTIRGTKPGTATLIPPLAPPVAGELAIELLIDQVNRVTIRDLNFSAPNEEDCQFLDAVILVSGSQNATIRNNQLSAAPRLSGCGYSAGIVAEAKEAVKTPTAGSLIRASATISHNTLKNFQYLGIGADSSGVNTTITHNTMHYYLIGTMKAAAVPYRQHAPATLLARHSFRAFGPAGNLSPSGIILEGQNSALVEGNTITSAGDANVNVAVQDVHLALVNGIAIFAHSGSLSIQGNHIQRVINGMYIQANGAVITKNVVTTTSEGLEIGFDGVGNTVRGNTFRGITDGIYVDSATSDNDFRNNAAASAHGWACQDTTTGTGTDGTDDTWAHNTGNISSPSGICLSPF